LDTAGHKKQQQKAEEVGWLVACFFKSHAAQLHATLLLQKKQNDLRPHTPYKQQESEYLSAPK
jgi:hypothetical protein